MFPRRQVPFRNKQRPQILPATVELSPQPSADDGQTSGGSCSTLREGCKSLNASGEEDAVPKAVQQRTRKTQASIARFIVLDQSQELSIVRRPTSYFLQRSCVV